MANKHSNDSQQSLQLWEKVSRLNEELQFSDSTAKTYLEMFKLQNPLSIKKSLLNQISTPKLFEMRQQVRSYYHQTLPLIYKLHLQPQSSFFKQNIILRNRYLFFNNIIETKQLMQFYMIIKILRLQEKMLRQSEEGKYCFYRQFFYTFICCFYFMHVCNSFFLYFDNRFQSKCHIHEDFLVAVVPNKKYSYDQYNFLYNIQLRSIMQIIWLVFVTFLTLPIYQFNYIQLIVFLLYLSAMRNFRQFFHRRLQYQQKLDRLKIQIKNQGGQIQSIRMKIFFLKIDTMIKQLIKLWKKTKQLINNVIVY